MINIFSKSINAKWTQHPRPNFELDMQIPFPVLINITPHIFLEKYVQNNEKDLSLCKSVIVNQI